MEHTNSEGLIMATAETIAIAKDFSPYPAGRNRSDGPFSGEKFRDDLLVPALKRESLVTVMLDGTLGYGSSFLEEAFGGLIRSQQWSPNDLRAKLILRSKDEILQKEIWNYIDDAWHTLKGR